MRINRSLITFLPDSGAGSGTVTSVALTSTMPTGLSATITGSPITTAGTIDISIAFAAGYAIPTTIKQSNWDDAYTWVSNFPSQTSNVGKFLTTDGSTLSWGTPSSVNIYNTSGTLTGNRLVTGSGYFLQFDANIGIGKNPAYPLDVNGTGAFTSVLTGNIINNSNPIFIYTTGNTGGAAVGVIGFSYTSTINRITSDGIGGVSTDLGIMAGGGGGQLYLGTSGTNRWFVTGNYNALGSGHLLPTSDTIYNIGNISNRVWKYYGVKGFFATNIQIGGTTEYSSSLLTMESTNKGFLPPRMTLTDRSMIALPQIGLLVYQTDGDEGLWQFTNGSGWQQVGGGFSGTVTSVGLTSLTGPVTITGSPVTSSGNINIEIGYASASTDGLLSQSDFANFTDKMNNPFTALGQMIYSNAAGIPLVIQPNVTGTTKFLAQFGNGTNANAPFWGSLGPEFVANAIQTDYVYDIIGDIDGINTTFYTQFNYSPGTTKVYVNGLRYTLGTGYDYEELGFGTINFTTPPEAGDLIIIEYVKT